MKQSTLFKEYIWLVNTIHRAGRISLSEINDLWLRTDMSGGVEYSRSTFMRHRAEVEDIFGLIIDCDSRGGYKYYIANAEVLEGNSIQNWMLSTISVSNILSESHSVHHRILLERIPSDGAYLHRVIEAMKRSCTIRLHYKRYSAEAERELIVAPYCVKLFRQRWYLLGRRPSGQYLVLSFDRISTIEVQDETFALDPEFDAEKHFADCYGIVQGDGTEAEHIVLRAYGNERNYIADLPLHPSQHIEGTSDGYTDFGYYMRPTLDLAGYITSRGAQLKVLTPRHLADEVCRLHREALALYDTEGRGTQMQAEKS